MIAPTFKELSKLCQDGAADGRYTSRTSGMASTIPANPAMDDDGHTPRLEQRRTFVVQLHSGCNARDGELRGRVEHLTSGDSEPFASLAALLEFISRFEAAAG